MEYWLDIGRQEDYQKAQEDVLEAGRASTDMRKILNIRAAAGYIGFSRLLRSCSPPGIRFACWTTWPMVANRSSGSGATQDLNSFAEISVIAQRCERRVGPGCRGSLGGGGRRSGLFPPAGSGARNQPRRVACAD